MATAQEVFDQASQIQGVATDRVRDRAEEIRDEIDEYEVTVETGNYQLSRLLDVPRLVLQLASISTDVTLADSLVNFNAPSTPPEMDGVATEIKVPAPAAVLLQGVDIPGLVIDSLEDATYSTYSEPPPLPTYSAGDPDLVYPEAAFIAIDDSAGLTVLDAPNITVGATPSFLDIEPLSYNLDEIELLDAVEPVPPDLPDIELLSSPTRLAHVIDEDVVDALVQGMEGEPVLETYVQDLIRKQAQVPVDIEFDRAERALVDGSAAAGFSSFTGPLIHSLSQLTQDASYKDRASFEAARDESYKRALAHVTTSLKSAMRLELANAAMHFEYASKIVETLQVNIAIQVDYANTLVNLFNEQVRVLKAKIAAYNAYVEASVEKYTAEIQAALSERVILETNAAKLTAYGAQIETLQQQARSYGIQVSHDTQPIQEYRTYIEGLLKNVDIVRTNLSSMQEAIRIFGQAVDSDKAKLAAYSSQIKATGSATDVYSANWNTYGDYVSAYSTQTGAVRTWAESNLQNIRSVVGLYETQAGSHRQYEQEREQQIQRIGSLKDQYVSAVAAYTDESTRYNRANSILDGADDETALLEEENTAREQLLEAQRIAAQAEIDLGLATAAATSQSATAQAAQSILSYTAGYSGSASASGSATETDSVSFNDNANHTYKFNINRTA